MRGAQVCTVFVSLVAWVAVAACGAPAASGHRPAAGAEKTPPTPCEGEGRHRAFDFWLGTWEVENPDGELVGKNRIERAEAGCALVEHWRGKNGGTGTSINHIDPASGHWNQRWVSSQGVVIDLEGGPTGDGTMVLEGTMTRPDGQKVPMRGTWRHLQDGRVEQRFSISKDGGATWTQAFRGLYTKVE